MTTTDQAFPCLIFSNPFSECFFRNYKEPLIIFDEIGTIKDMNNTALDYFKLDSNSLQQRNIKALVPIFSDFASKVSQSDSFFRYQSRISDTPVKIIIRTLNSQNDLLFSMEINRFKLLVVDDNLICRKTVLKLLESKGFLCDEAPNGQEALASLAQKAYDAVITDLEMPGMDGCEESRMWKDKELKQGRRFSIPFILNTARSLDPNLIKRCHECGIEIVLEKPLSWEKLKQVFENLATTLNPIE